MLPAPPVVLGRFPSSPASRSLLPLQSLNSAPLPRPADRVGAGGGLKHGVEVEPSHECLEGSAAVAGHVPGRAQPRPRKSWFHRTSVFVVVRRATSRPSGSAYCWTPATQGRRSASRTAEIQRHAPPDIPCVLQIQADVAVRIHRKDWRVVDRDFGRVAVPVIIRDVVRV